MKHLYPADLSKFVSAHWPDDGDGDELPPTATFENLISHCYQASLLRQENIPVVFRLLVIEPEELPAEAGPPTGLHRLEFARHLEFNALELRRLSSAANFSRTLIGVRIDPDNGPEIWGLVHSGPRWLHAIHGGRGTAPPLPKCLAVSVTGPGYVDVARGREVIGHLAEGRVFGPSMNLFQSEWLHEWFASINQERQDIHAEAKKEASEPWADLEPDLTRVIGQHMMRRLIAGMRAFHHGGTLVVVPPEMADMFTHENPYLSIKYAFVDGEQRARFRTLIITVMNTLAKIAGDQHSLIGWREYRQTTNPDIIKLDEAIFEMSHLVAALSTVDGAVVLTRRFELLGFGAEIHCESTELNFVAKALDLEGEHSVIESVQSVGTRHRSAYRICNALKDVLSIILSQDGNVQFARWKDDNVMYWNEQAAFNHASVY
jgi:hypothetical protein